MRQVAAVLLCLSAAWAQSIQNAQMLERAGRRKEAIDEYCAVLARTPGDIVAYIELRRLSQELESYDSLQEGVNGNTVKKQEEPQPTREVQKNNSNGKDSKGHMNLADMKDLTAAILGAL